MRGKKCYLGHLWEPSEKFHWSWWGCQQRCAAWNKKKGTCLSHISLTRKKSGRELREDLGEHRDMTPVWESISPIGEGGNWQLNSKEDGEEGTLSSSKGLWLFLYVSSWQVMVNASEAASLLRGKDSLVPQTTLMRAFSVCSLGKFPVALSLRPLSYFFCRFCIRCLPVMPLHAPHLSW